MRSAADTLFVSLGGVMLGQYGLALTVCVWLIGGSFRSAAGLCALDAGLICGGPGTVAAVAATMEQHEFADVLPTGMVLAMIGLFAGNVGGMLFVNLGIRAGWTRIVLRRRRMKANPRTIFLSPIISPPSAARPFVRGDGGADVADRRGAGNDRRGARDAISRQPNHSLFSDLPLFVCAMPAALLVRRLLLLLMPHGLPDDELMARLGAVATDFLVRSASPQSSCPRCITGSADFALALIGFVSTVLAIWIAGRRLFYNYWFERSIFAYGWTIGVLATAVALLRSVDPEFKTKTHDHFALANLIIGPLEIALVVLMPWLVVHNHLAVREPCYSFSRRLASPLGDDRRNFLILTDVASRRGMSRGSLVQIHKQAPSRSFDRVDFCALCVEKCRGRAHWMSAACRPARAKVDSISDQ